MTSVGTPADRNVDGILKHMREYLNAREEQVVRMNPDLKDVIKDVIWIHLEILRSVIQKPKSFGGEKYRVADVLAGADGNKRKALLSNGDQNSIMDEIIERTDEPGKAVDTTIHDMRTLFRSINPALENLVQLIQHWVKWDVPDASDLHSFDEQVRRLTALRGIALTDDLRGRYRQALKKTADATVTDQDIFQMEIQRLEQIAGSFCNRRHEDEAYQLIICRDDNGDEAHEPYNFKLRQCDTVTSKLKAEQEATKARIANSGEGSAQSESAE